MPVRDDAYRSCGEGTGCLFVCLFVHISWDESFIEQVFLLPTPACNVQGIFMGTEQIACQLLWV